jgi:poly(A) polymerase
MNRNAIAIVDRLRRHGHQALLVGGCVRDLLLGIKPKDYDVATSAEPPAIMALFRRTIPVGARFGVVIVRMGGRNYEVATFREDEGYSDGRHPDGVRFTTARADARRRDFTINGMFYDPVAERVIDYVGGRRDLERGVIRAIGDPDRRFGEDKLRMLRAVRFAARFGYRLEARTAAAIARHAAEISQVSPERIRDELILLLTCPRPADGLRLLERHGLLPAVLPEIAAMRGVPQPPEFHPEGDTLDHTTLMLELMSRGRKWPVELALAVLLHDVGKPRTFEVLDRIRFNNHPVVGAEMAGEILSRLRFPRDTIGLVSDLVRDHLKFIDVERMRPATLKRFLRQERFDLHLELHRLDCLGSHGDLSAWRFCRRRLRELGRRKEALRPPRLISGDDLIALGLAPGPEFKRILAAVEDAQLEGAIKTREEALALVRSRL